MPDRGMSCFEVTLERPLARSSNPSVDTARASWPAQLGSTALIGPGIIRLGFDSSRTIRLLVVVDVSGSMKGEGMAFTRSALRGFLNALPKSGLEVALVPFDSKQVASRFASAKFGAPAAALASLAGLPAPAGNTALYSSVAEGLRLLDRPGATNAANVLLVITDGVNDVGRAGDDPGLLSGDPGRQQARALIANSAHNVWLVGVGPGTDVAELRSLAGNRATAAVVALDPGALLSLLERIRLSLATQYTLVYGIPSNAAARLGRRPARVAIRGGSVLPAPWRPPLLARPLLRGSADSTLLSPDLRVLAASGQAPGSDRLIVGAALLAVLLALYALLWRLGNDLRGAPSTKPAVVPPKASERSTGDSPLRRDAVDAPPRSPQDITNEEAA
jgi:hypothetical protein